MVGTPVNTVTRWELPTLIANNWLQISEALNFGNIRHLREQKILLI